MVKDEEGDKDDGFLVGIWEGDNDGCGVVGVLTISVGAALGELAVAWASAILRTTAVVVAVAPSA